MGSLDVIRKAFSKGTIAVKSGSVSVIYTDQDFVHQEFKNNGIATLKALTESCSKIIFWIRKGDFVRIGFVRNNDGNEVLYYDATKSEITKEEIDRVIADMKPSEEFLDFFADVDLKDEDKVKIRFAQWLDMYNQMNPRPDNIDNVIIWPELKSKDTEFAESMGFEIKATDPDDISDGFAEIWLPENPDAPIIIDGENKELFREILDLCSIIEFEMNPADGIVNLITYV